MPDRERSEDVAATAAECRASHPTDTVGPVTAAIEQLRRLRRLGFRAAPLLDRDGRFEALYLAREYGGVRDAVIVYSETEALAYRTRSPWDSDRPFHLDPNAVHWRRHGDLVGVTNMLLALPPRPNQAPGPGKAPEDEPDH